MMLLRRNRSALRGLTALLAVVLLALPAARALETAEWSTRQALTVDRAGVIKLTLPPATLDAARADLGDLRLLDPAGRETPFLLQRPVAETPALTRGPRAFHATIETNSTELLFETGTGAAPLDALIVATPANNFLKSARVEISSDGNTWETLASGTPVFRQFGADQLRFALGGHAAAHVRVTIDDSRSAPVPFTGGLLRLVPAERPPPVLSLPVRVTRRDEFAGETLLTLDLGAAHVPLAGFEFTTAETLFARNLTFAGHELHDETATERTLGAGAIWRVAADGLVPVAHLETPVAFTAPSREVLVHVANGDSPPLDLGEITARYHPVWLIFRATQAGNYTLLSGHASIAAPRYDLAKFSSELRTLETDDYVPGSPEANPGYRRPDALADTPLRGAALDPAPWARRKPVYLAHPGVQELELDLDVLAGAQPDLADLRLLRDGAQVPYLVERTALSRTTALPVAPADDPRRPGTSRWQIRLPRAGLPFTRVTLASPTTLFQRHLRLYEKIPDENGGEPFSRVLAESDWSHTPGQTPPITLGLPASPATDTLWLETANGDNPPIALASAQAAWPVSRLFFRTTADPLALYYSNHNANAPRYDLALVAGQILSAEKSAAALGAEEKLAATGAASSALGGLRTGALFWGVLALVVVTLLVVVAKLLPAPPKQG